MPSGIAARHSSLGGEFGERPTLVNCRVSLQYGLTQGHTGHAVIRTEGLAAQKPCHCGVDLARECPHCLAVTKRYQPIDHRDHLVPIEQHVKTTTGVTTRSEIRLTSAAPRSKAISETKP